MRRSTAVLSGVIVLACALPAAHADTVTFANLTGPQGLPVTTYTEGSFTVTVFSGSWGEEHAFGNVVPSISSTSSSAVVDITRVGGGTFTFNSVDLGNQGGGSSNYFIQGFLNTNWIYGLSSSVPVTNAFATINSYDTNMQMDTLRITMSIGEASSYAVDNINVGPVPEPASLLLFGAAAVPALLVRRRLRGG